MKSILHIIIALCLMTNITVAQDNLAAQAARESLDNFKKGISGDNFKQLGFSSLEESQNLSVGPEVKSYYMRLDELRNFKSGQSFGQLLKPSERSIFILNNTQNEAVGSIEMELIKKKWQIKSIGKSTVVTDYVNSIKQQTATSNWVLIKVLALNRNFAAYNSGNVWKGYLLGTEPLGEIRPNQEIELDDALPELQKAANEYNGLPW